MALIVCRKCRREVSNKSDQCRFCGEAIDTPVALNGISSVNTKTRTNADDNNVLVALLVIPLVLVGGCVLYFNGSEPDTSMKAEFLTLEACLSSLHAETGETLVPTIDDPDMVSGRLSNGEMWWCKKCESGTRGTYWEAMYKP